MLSTAWGGGGRAEARLARRQRPRTCCVVQAECLCEGLRPGVLVATRYHRCGFTRRVLDLRNGITSWLDGWELLPLLSKAVFC